MKAFVLALLAASVALAAPPVISKQSPDGTVNRTAWMAEGGFGMMVHYLPLPPAGSREEQQAWVDRTVDAFDLAGFMRQFDETASCITAGGSTPACRCPMSNGRNGLQRVVRAIPIPPWPSAARSFAPAAT